MKSGKPSPLEPHPESAPRRLQCGIDSLLKTLFFSRYTFATNYTDEERHTILDAMNNLAELVNSGSDNKTCISYTPYDPEKDEGKSRTCGYSFIT